MCETELQILKSAYVRVAKMCACGCVSCVDARGVFVLRGEILALVLFIEIQF